MPDLPDRSVSSVPGRPFDPVGLAWLVTVRWAGIAAGIGALAAGADLRNPAAIAGPILLVTAAIVSNLWLTWRIKRGSNAMATIGGWLVAADVVVLSWILRESGGVLNPASIFYLVDIVLAALVLGRAWTWTIALLSIAGYGVLFLVPPHELAIAGAMHPEIAVHVRGMWIAFAAAALIVALLVSRLASMVERRDRALTLLQERASRDARVAALATLSAGAAHELSTPLGTIAVAARELERLLETSGVDGTAVDDARLIREEVDRCRRVLDDMSGRTSEPVGEMPVSVRASDVVSGAIATLADAERARVTLRSNDDIEVVWPVRAVERALVNVLRNGLQASHEKERVDVIISKAGGDNVAITIEDRGHGMSEFVRARAGEPFFTTKAAGAGMGLGLFVTGATVDQMGGRVQFDSRQGAGTTVTISLPSHVERNVGA